MLLITLTIQAALLASFVDTAIAIGLADHITANVPGIVHTIRSYLETPLNATRDEHSSEHSAAIGAGLLSISGVLESEVHYIAGAPLIVDPDEGAMVLNATQNVAQAIVYNADLLATLVPLIRCDLLDLHERLVDLNHWSSGYFQWIAYHNSLEPDGQQQLWKETIVALGGAVEAAKEPHDCDNVPSATPVEGILEL